MYFKHNFFKFLLSILGDPDLNLEHVSAIFKIKIKILLVGHQ